MRLQLALNVENLDEAIPFYEQMFGTQVSKRKPGYANFAIDRPPLKLVLFEAPDAPERINHLGVEVFDDEEVTAAINRLQDGELEHIIEQETICCYATQNKVWAREPQGLRWEWYRVLADSEKRYGPRDRGLVPDSTDPGLCCVDEEPDPCCAGQDADRS
ncbi:MAG: VOC family protein [Alphaproteobacteria bacterium]|nr:VOC family protein [Alphaproteobacteria bacterium]